MVPDFVLSCQTGGCPDAPSQSGDAGSGTAVANPDGTVTGANGEPIRTGANGERAGQRFRPESSEERADAEGTPCQYCGQPTTNEPGQPNSRERDHGTARSRGGNGSSDNENPACRTCNRSKGANDVWEWVRRTFGGGRPRHWRFSDLRRRRVRANPATRLGRPSSAMRIWRWLAHKLGGRDD